MGWVFFERATLALLLAASVGCQSVAGYAPVSPSPESDAGADVGLDTAPVDSRAEDGAIDATPRDVLVDDTRVDLEGDRSAEESMLTDSSVDVPPVSDSSVDVPPVTDSSVDVPPVADSSVDVSSPTDSTLDQTSPDLEVDGSTLADATVDQGAPPRVEITEILPWVNAVIDERGEWFEVFNPGPGELSLQNWRIVVSRSFHTISADVRIPAYSYAVLAVNGRSSQNGGVDVLYEYGTDVRLDNDGPEMIRIERPDGSVADEVNFDVGPWGIIEGQALSYIGGDKNSSGSWCGETMQWLPPNSDYGTPGGPRGCGL